MMTSIAQKQGVLAHPDIAARRPYPISTTVRNTIFLFEVDGPAVVAKRGANEWIVLAPTFDEVSPHIHRIVAYLFYDTDALAIWFDTTMLAYPPASQVVGDISVVGNTLGAERKGVWSKQTRVDGEITLRAFSAWRLSAERRPKTYEPIRIEGGRVRRAMQKAGAVLDKVRPDDRRTLKQLLGFLACARANTPKKASTTTTSWRYCAGGALAARYRRSRSSRSSRSGRG